MVKRKLRGAVDESSADQEILKSDTALYITCENSKGLHQAEPGLTAGWLTKFGRGSLKIKIFNFCFV